MNSKINKIEVERAMQIFGKHIAKLRKEKGLSQEDLAESCRCYSSKISRTECGKQNLTMVSLIVLAKGLGVSFEKLTACNEINTSLDNIWKVGIH